MLIYETVYLCVKKMNIRVVNDLKEKKNKKNNKNNKEYLIEQMSNINFSKGSWIGEKDIKWEVNLIE